LQLTIEKLVYGGDGLARLPADEKGRGKAAFLPFVLTGEQVEASLLEQKPGFARARAEKILQPSPRRVVPRCPYFQACGGCHYQHASYEHQIEIKAAILRENLRRIAKLEIGELTVHPSPPWQYRNRTRLKVRCTPETEVGYYRFNSREFLPVRECPISSPLINRAIAVLWNWKDCAENLLREIELFTDAEDSQLLIELYCEPTISEAAGAHLANTICELLPEAAGAVVFADPAAQHGAAEREPGRIVAAGATELLYSAGSVRYRVSAGAFFQVNRHLVSELANVATQEYSGEAALDLYAGVGLFSAILARSFAQVTAVEASQTSRADLVHNGPGNVKAVRASTEQYLQREKRKFDLVVVDPPRGGLGASVIRSLGERRARSLVYVSCDPATLARDLRALGNSGYRITQAHLMDMFPQTYHVESVFHLARA